MQVSCNHIQPQETKSHNLNSLSRKLSKSDHWNTSQKKKRAFHSSRQGLENDELKPTKNPIQHKVFQSFLTWRCQQFRYLKLMWFCFGLHMFISLGRAVKSLCLSKISLDSLLVIVLFNHQCMYLCISDKSLFYWVCMYVFFCNKRLHIFSNMVILSMFPDCGEERHWKNLIKS